MTSMTTTRLLQSARRSRPRQRGLTLVELMVALAIGLVLLLAMSAVFVTSSTTRREIELSADVLESGRYALDVLNRELTQTGFYGPLHDATVPGRHGAAPGTPTALTTNAGANVCSTDAAVWAGSLPVHVVGLRSAALANVDGDPGCLAERKDGTDAIFIQRVATCTAAECGPEVATKRYLQVSECGDEYNDTANAKSFVVVPGLDGTVRQNKLCAGGAAPRREVIRRIFYITNNDALAYKDITPAGAGNPVILADNIEQLQIVYGLDGDADNDGVVDSAVDGTADGFFAGPKAGATAAEIDAFWSNVVGARVWLLARSTNTSANITQATSYVMDDTTVTTTAGTRGLKRRIYSSYISFVSPKARREQ